MDRSAGGQETGTRTDRYDVKNALPSFAPSFPSCMYKACIDQRIFSLKPIPYRLIWRLGPHNPQTIEVKPGQPWRDMNKKRLSRPYPVPHRATTGGGGTPATRRRGLVLPVFWLILGKQEWGKIHKAPSEQGLFHTSRHKSHPLKPTKQVFPLGHVNPERHPLLSSISYKTTHSC